jgi:hypothetical protein
VSLTTVAVVVVVVAPGGSGSGGGGGGGRRLVAKAAGNKSINGCMTTCNDKSGRWTTMQQPTK